MEEFSSASLTDLFCLHLPQDISGNQPFKFSTVFCAFCEGVEYFFFFGIMMWCGIVIRELGF